MSRGSNRPKAEKKIKKSSANGVLILECLDEIDPGSEGRFLSHMFNLMEVPSQYAEIRTKEQFTAMLGANQFDVLHITTHGHVATKNDKFIGFWTPKGTVRLTDFPEDEALIARFHTVPWEERPPIVLEFMDPRLKKIGQRLIYLERPDLLPDAERARYNYAIAARLTRDDAEVPWLTLHRAIADLDDLISDAGPGEAAFLLEHRAQLAGRLEKAALALDAKEIAVEIAEADGAALITAPLLKAAAQPQPPGNSDL